VSHQRHQTRVSFRPAARDARTFLVLAHSRPQNVSGMVALAGWLAGLGHADLARVGVCVAA
jgi:hypothetical protein